MPDPNPESPTKSFDGPQCDSFDRPSGSVKLFDQAHPRMAASSALLAWAAKLATERASTSVATLEAAPAGKIEHVTNGKIKEKTATAAKKNAGKCKDLARDDDEQPLSLLAGQNAKPTRKSKAKSKGKFAAKKVSPKEAKPAKAKATHMSEAALLALLSDDDIHPDEGGSVEDEDSEFDR